MEEHGRVSTTKSGNTFRDDIAQLLELIPQISNVKTEYRIGSQEVDIYYEERTSTTTRRVACECKNYAKPLTKSKIASEIYPRYRPLRDEGLADDVRIIAPLKLGPTAQQYVKWCRFAFITRDELESSLIDFRAYLQSLHALYMEGGLHRYYIRPILEDKTDLEDRVDAWLREESSQPIAILAGYGMGKTSFARRLSRVVADEHIASGERRIPILIPLAEISSEQTLEGLLGKLFTAQNVVAGYQFGLFMELNRRGRFLLILDGFDEMKHTMSWSEFRHNITQLHRLVTAGSKVILLGRPNALLSDVEELFVLKGVRKDREKVFSIPGAPEYIELSLQPFSEEQAIAFINGYAAYRAENDAAVRGKLTPLDEISRRLEEVRHDEKLKELIVRPVQAKMIADLAIDPNAEWRSFSRYELYDEFVSRIINREALKPTRQSFDEQQRRQFIEQVAWWLWRKGGVAGFDVEGLPKQLVRRFSGEDVDGDDEGVTRDLLAGSLLERKTGEKYYFPHRSFLEFLVARHMATSEWTSRDVGELSESVNPEIAAFLKESGQHVKIATWANLIDHVEAPLSLRFIELVAWAMNESGRTMSDGADPDVTPGGILLNYLRLADKSATPTQIVTYLVRSFEHAADTSTKLMCLTALLLARESVIVDFRARIGRLAVALVLKEALPEIQRTANQAPSGRSLTPTTLFAEIVTSAIRGRPASGGAFIVCVDWQKLFKYVRDELPPQWRLYDGLTELTMDDEQFPLADLGAHVSILKLTEKGAYVVRFLRRLGEPTR